MGLVLEGRGGGEGGQEKGREGGEVKEEEKEEGWCKEEGRAEDHID